nr:winged helix-turn-helix domain-containing protein [Streptomyces guryensis]
MDFAVLEPLLLDGAMAVGWADERWTLSRVQLLIADQPGVLLSIRGMWELLRRHGWSCQQPARRTIERDDEAVAGTWQEKPCRISSLRTPCRV